MLESSLRIENCFLDKLMLYTLNYFNYIYISYLLWERVEMLKIMNDFKIHLYFCALFT